MKLKHYIFMEKFGIYNMTQYEYILSIDLGGDETSASLLHIKDENADINMQKLKFDDNCTYKIPTAFYKDGEKFICGEINLNGLLFFQNFLTDPGALERGEPYPYFEKTKLELLQEYIHGIFNVLQEENDTVKQCCNCENTLIVTGCPANERWTKEDRDVQYAKWISEALNGYCTVVFPNLPDEPEYLAENLALLGRKYLQNALTEQQQAFPQFEITRIFRMGEGADEFSQIIISDYFDNREDMGYLIRQLNRSEKYGFFNVETGDIIVEPDYDNMNYFSEGLAPVKIGDKWGYVDLTGKQVIPCLYDEAERFCFGEADVRIGDDTHKISKPDNISPWGKYSYAYEENKEEYHNGMRKVEENEKYGYEDKWGNLVIPCIYDYAGDFSEGLALVGGEGLTKAQSGYIDRTGKISIPTPGYWAVDRMHYAYYGEFHDGLAIIGCYSKHSAYGYPELTYGFIDKSGKEVVPLVYDDILPFSDGLAAFKKEDGHVGWVDKNGKEVLPDVWTDHQKLFKGIDSDVFWMHEKPADVFMFSEGLTPVFEYGPGWGYLNKSGKLAIPFKYSQAYCFKEGLARVFKTTLFGKQNGYGFYDCSGTLVIPCQYEDAEDFLNGVAKVSQNRENFLIDRKGNRITPLNVQIYKTINTDENSGVRIVCNENNKKYGCANRKEELFIPCEYDELEFEGDIFIRGKKEGKCGLFDRKGNVIIDVEYKECKFLPAIDTGLAVGEDYAYLLKFKAAKEN